MLNNSFRSAVLVALMSACGALMTGCYAEVQAEPMAEYGYQPQFYEGAVVYYDGGGRPYYYNNGAVYWVPASSPYYYGYVNHWRTYGPAYSRWYAGSGYRYRGWRGAPRRYR